MTRFRLLLPLTTAALLAACGGEPADEGRDASGEVIEGTITDAMLPLDAVRSQPPLAEPEAARRARAGAGAESAAPDEGAEGEAAEEPEEEAVEVPSIEPAGEIEPAEE